MLMLLQMSPPGETTGSAPLMESLCAVLTGGCAPCLTVLRHANLYGLSGVLSGGPPPVNPSRVLTGRPSATNPSRVLTGRPSALGRLPAEMLTGRPSAPSGPSALGRPSPPCGLTTVNPPRSSATPPSLLQILGQTQSFCGVMLSP